EAAVRMRREAREVIVRIVGEELVEHQERVEAQVRAAAEAAPQLDARAIRRRHRLEYGLQPAVGHGRRAAGAESRSLRVSSDQSPGPRATRNRKPPAIARFFMNSRNCIWSPSALWKIAAETIEKPASRNANRRVRQPTMIAMAPITSSAITSGNSIPGTP